MKNFRQQQKRPKKSALVCGRDAVEKVLAAGEPLDKILLQTNVQSEQIDRIRTLANDAGVPVTRVPVEKLNYLNVYNHEGCIAYKARVQYRDLQQVISYTVEKGETPLFLLLDGITDIRNIGGIARSAYAMGVHAIVLPEKGVGALNEDAMLASAGALDHQNVCRTKTLEHALETLKLNGIKVLATQMRAQLNIFDADMSEPLALIMGGEEKGVLPALLKSSDAVVKIPMTGDFESLNVSVATGIALYEVARQRSISR